MTRTHLTCLALVLALLAYPALAQVSVTDFAGREVNLARPAQRIVALAPHITEHLFSVGAGAKVVGVTSYSDYPPRAQAIREVGTFAAWSLEVIVSLQPDLVVMWASGNGMDKLPVLERLGFTVYVSEPRRLADVPRALRDLGTLAGTPAAAEVQARQLEQGLASLRSRYWRDDPVSVFYQVWHRPLQTVNGEHMISDVIRLCGGENIFALEPDIAPRVSIEAVLYRDPEVIVASGMDQARPEWLDDWSDYPHLTAVRNNALLFVDPDHLQRPTMRILQGAESLCRQLAHLPAAG